MTNRCAWTIANDYPIIRHSRTFAVTDATHLLWLVSRSVVDTLYWTETVTTSRLNVVDDADVVWVLVWLVEYSRGVVYVTELISVTESKRVKEKNSASGGCFPAPSRKEGMGCRRRQGEGHMESGRDGMRNVRRRQYLRVRRPANIHACVTRNVTSRAVPRASGTYRTICKCNSTFASDTSIYLFHQK